MRNEKNEKRAILIGFVLIVFVILFTLLRGKIFTNKDKSNGEEGDGISTQIASLPYATISANDLNKKILTVKDKAELTLLDVRSFEDYDREHIVDSVNITPEEFSDSFRVDTHSTIIIIAENSKDTDINEIIEKLKEKKIENFKVLAGGMESWKQLVGSVVTYGNPESFVDQSKISYLDPQSLNDALKKQVPVFIVDVRTADEFTRGHIAGAINIPFDDLEKRRSEITERKIIVVGINELQEFQASVQLYDMLLVSPYVMRGAMPAWESNNFPIVTN